MPVVRRATHREPRFHDDNGAATAEYAVGTVAATGFASLLFLLGPFIESIFRACLDAAVSLAGHTFGPVFWR